MQTFLPYPDIPKAAQCLDRLRLGKQRIECIQILRCMNPNYTHSWRNHPATKMWKGYKVGLVYYYICILEEWKRRRYLDTTESFLSQEFKQDYGFAKSLLTRKHNHWSHLQSEGILPKWFGGLIHSSHRSALLSKDYAHYSQFGWIEDPQINYYWPTKNDLVDVGYERGEHGTHS